MSEQLIAEIEEAAHSGAHGLNAAPCPSDKQHVAGNYKKGRIAIQGMPVVIEQPRYSLRTGVSYMGEHWSCRMAAHYGYFAGVPGADGDELDVFIGPVPDAETLYIVNQVLGGNFDEHKVMLGFADESQARNAYLNSYDRNWQGLGSMVPVSINDFKKWIASGVPARAVVPSDFKKGVSRMQSLLLKHISWDSAAKPVGSNLDRVLYDLRRKDDDPEMFYTPMTMDSIKDDADDEGTFDSLVMPFAQMERKMDVVQRVLNRTSSELEVSNLEISEPFTSAGSANVAAIFTLSDGQTVTIYMHNPDTTPKKIMPTDEVVSWKWLLNRTDITIAVAPERGQDLNIREVARRIMKLAEKNMTRFAAAQKRAADTRAMIEEAEAANDQLETELADAKAELASLQAIQADYQASLSASGAAANAEQIGERNGDIVSGEVPAEGMYVVLSHAPGYLGRGKEGYEGYSVPPKDLGDVRYAPVSSMKEASEMVRGFIDRNELGASNFNGGQVYQDGVQVAHISYNGRAWSGADRFAADKQEIDISEGALTRESVEVALTGAGWTKGDDGAFRRTLSSEGESMAVRVLYEGGELRAYEGDEAGQVAFVTFPDGDKSADDAAAELYGLLDDELEAKIERDSVTPEEAVTAEGYAKLVDADALDDYADILDSEFSKRMMGVRNRLYDLGWEKRSETDAWPLTLEGKTIDVEFERNSSGTNNVAVTYAIGSKMTLPDGFYDPTAVIADRLHKLSGFEVTEPGERLPSSRRFANLLEGLGWNISEDGDYLVASYGDGMAAASVPIQDMPDGTLRVDGDEVRVSDLGAYASDLHEEMMSDDMSELYEMYGLSASEDASNYRDEAFVKALHMAVELINRKGGRVNFGNFDASLSGGLFDAAEVPAKARIIAQIVDALSNEPVGRLAIDGNAITIYRGLSGDEALIDESRRITDVAAALDEILSGSSFQPSAEQEKTMSIIQVAFKDRGVGIADWSYEENIVASSYPRNGKEEKIEIYPNGSASIGSTDTVLASVSDIDNIAKVMQKVSLTGEPGEGYEFEDMPSGFRQWLASMSDDVFSPIDTAYAMENAAKDVGLRIKWGFFSGPALDSAFDGVDEDGYHGKVYRGSTLLGRIDMGGDGKAMVFIGKAGNRRPKTSLGNDFSYSAGDAPNMIKALAEQAGDNPDQMRVVVRYVPIFKQWSIAHAASYQNAFGSDVNKFATREDAVDYAESKGAKVEYHEYDALQRPGVEKLDPNGNPLESESTEELTDNEVKAKGQEALQSLINGKFISRTQGKTIDGMISRSEEWRFFADKMIELKERIDTMAQTGEQDGKGMNATAYLHYFGGSYDAYITEKDMDGGVDQAFGWASFGQGGELGYISIAEIAKQPGIELDLHFDPKSLNQALGRDTVEESEPQEGAAISGELLMGSDSDVDITFRKLNGLYTEFLPESKAGEDAWREIAEKNGGDAKILNTFVESTIQQLMDAGYSVKESERDISDTVSIEELRNELKGMSSPESSPEQTPSNPDNDYLNQVIAGELDLTDNAVIEEIEAIAGRIEGDSAMEEKLTSAINAVEKAMLEATNNMS